MTFVLLGGAHRHQQSLWQHITRRLEILTYVTIPRPCGAPGIKPVLGNDCDVPILSTERRYWILAPRWLRRVVVENPKTLARARRTGGRAGDRGAIGTSGQAPSARGE